MITKMKVMVISHAQQNPIKKEDPKEKEATKCFDPKLLTAAYWSKDVLDASLEKLNVARNSRM